MTRISSTQLPRTGDTQAADDALLTLLHQLRKRDYRFVTPTPATHARVVGRPSSREVPSLRDVFGWSQPFDPARLEPALLRTLLLADAIDRLADGKWKCRYRVSSLGQNLFLPSAYPTNAEDAVFFGPDSYRFAELVRAELAHCPNGSGTLVDLGTGAGVGAIVAAQHCPGLRVHMTDINAQALRLAQINASFADIPVSVHLGPRLEAISEPIDIVLANPPYIIDPAAREYRDGGDMHGGRVSYDMAAEALDRLSPTGRLILYTGSAIVDGNDQLREMLADLAAKARCAIRYWEIDPDVFGEELENQAYHDVERIAVVGAVIARKVLSNPA